MGSPTKTQVENWSDLVAARIAADLAGYQTEYAAASITSLWDLVDASGDPDVEAALMASAAAMDAMSFPENHAVALAGILNRAGYQNFATALNTLVKSSAGGSHASLRAYLVSISAKLHPLFGELVMLLLGSSAFTSSSVVAGVSNPLYAAISPTRVYTGADGALADDTTDAIDVGTADVALFASDNDCLYVGSDRQFQGIVVALSTLASATITPTIQYWNGSAWTTLTVTNNTAGFTRNDTIHWTPPTDWGRYYKDGGGTAFADKARLYYVRIARTADALVTPPVATCITLIPSVIPTTTGGSLHLGITQPPLALCRINGVNSMVTILTPASIDYTRFAHPVGTENRLRLRALTPIGANLTVTLGYVDANGANASTAQSAWTAPAALDTKVLALTATDGLRSVRTTSTVVTAATEGVFTVECLPIRDLAI